MPLHIGRDARETSVILITFEAPWTWHELYIVRDLVRYLVDTSPEDAHFIYDMSRNRTPRGASGPHLRNFIKSLPAKAQDSLHAFVAASPDWKAHMTLFTRAYPELALDIVYVSSLEDARDSIQRKRDQRRMLDEMDEDALGETDELDPPLVRGS